MKPRKHIKSVSTARAKQRAEYEKSKPIYLTSNPMCIVCGMWVSWSLRTLHHFYKRRGKLLAWVPGYRTTHPMCHARIHKDETKARKCGWLAPKECCDDYQRAVKHEQELPF